MCARMCGARRITICFPVISSPTACTLLKQHAALVIGFILFLPLLCMDQLYLFCSLIRDSLLRRPHLPCCSWARSLAVPDGRKAVFPSHACCRAKYNTDFMMQDFPPSSPLSLCCPTTLQLSQPWAPHTWLRHVTVKDLFDYSTFAPCTALQLWESL